MKSNVCVIQKGALASEKILAEVDKVSVYNSLSDKDTLRLRLLAEELTGMLPELVENFDGGFWIENDGTKYELHVELSVDGMTKEKKEKLLAVSASNKNAAATGFMGKIREIAANMLLNSEDVDVNLNVRNYMQDYCNVDINYVYAWTLDNYIAKSKKSECSKEEWDQLEKSIVAKLADDVIVGIRGHKVDIIIKKEF